MRKIFTLIFSIALMQAFGQTIDLKVIASAGNNYTDNASGLNISWTLGETVIGTLENTGANLMLTQGFQQGNLFGVDAPNPEFPKLKLNMYPNPAINWVRFELNNMEAKGDFIVDLFDVTGRKIISKNLGLFVDQEAKELTISSLKTGIYLVKITIGSYSSDVMKLMKE